MQENHKKITRKPWRNTIQIPKSSSTTIKDKNNNNLSVSRTATEQLAVKNSTLKNPIDQY